MTDEQRLSMADSFRKSSTDDEQSYWAGYMRGTRRKMHGKKFGTDTDHKKYMTLAKDEDPSRKAIGRGYRDGLKGVVPEMEGLKIGLV